MCGCDTPPSGTLRLSVHQFGEIEALTHKWIESEKAGRDLGEPAIRGWVRDHWRDFLRARWLEHLQGRRYWIELDLDDFGLLQRRFQGSPLIGEILAQLMAGKENLNVIDWAHRSHVDMEEVHEILLAVDINSRRIECRFAPNTSVLN